MIKNIRGDVNREDINGNLSIGTRVLCASLSLRGQPKPSIIKNGGKAAFIEDVRADIEEYCVDESTSKVQSEIIKLLLDAGWEIGLEKRKGKVEENIIYYNLKGKIYWSIVSAYEDLRLHYESGNGIGKFYSRDFQFEPISEYDINMLSEISSNMKRKGTNKPIGKGKKGKKIIDDQHIKTRVAQKKNFGCKNYHLVDISENPNDDICLLCGDGGDLLCCDSCPSTFHLNCLKMDKLPSGDWHCTYCQCKICGLVSRNSQETGISADHIASVSLTCCLCEHKYHKSCLKDNDHSRGACFCGNRCRELFEKLQRLLGVKHEIGDGLSLTIISRSDDNVDSNSPHVAECNSKLEVALSITEDCFMPQYDNRSGINIIESVLYNCGSNFNRLNYRRFVTAILERGDEIICVATLRVHGNNVAEMPYITTSRWHRRQGMCRKFLTAIETTLSSLGVELLIIPSIPEHIATWSSAFGFDQMDLETKKAIENMNLVVFSNATMLHKKIQNSINDSLVGQHGDDLVSAEDPSNVNNNNNEAMFPGSLSPLPLADDGALDHEVEVNVHIETECHDFNLNICDHDEAILSNANDEAPGSDLPPVDDTIMNIDNEHGEKIDEKDLETVADNAVDYTLEYLRNLY